MRGRYMLLCLSVLLTQAVPADEVKQLDDLTISARPITSQSLEHVTQPYSILREDELKNKTHNTIGETLSLEPGVTASDFGQGASRPVIRGLGGPRLNVLSNGIGSLDVSSVSIDHNVSINPFNARQIEILRGPATILYGSGSSAGIVNVVDNRIPEFLPEFNASFNSQYQSASNGRQAALLAEGGYENLALHFDFFKQKTDDYDSADGRIFNSAVETSDINLGTSIIGDTGFFGVAFNRYETVYGIPFNPEEPDELPFIDMQQNRLDFAGQVDSPIPFFDQLRLRAAYNDYEHTEFEGKGEPGTVFTNDDWETRLEASHQPLNNWNGILGLQYRNRSFSAVGDEAFVPSTKQRTVGIFMFEDTDINDLHFEVGARYEYQQLEPASSSGFSTTTHNPYSLAAGVSWYFTDSEELGLNISRSQRAPVLEELFAGGPHHASETFETGDPSLDVETSNSIDLSIARPDGKWTWNVNFFLNYIEDFIYQEFNDVNNDGIADQVDEDGVLGAGDFFSVFVTQADALFYGIEIVTGINLYSGNTGDLDFRLFGDMVRGQLTDGEDLPRISPARIGGSLLFDNPRWSTSLDVIHVFAQNSVASLESKTDDYLMANFSARYKTGFIAGRPELFLQVNNILDEDAKRHTSFIKDRAPLTGRTINLGMELTF